VKGKEVKRISIECGGGGGDSSYGSNPSLKKQNPSPLGHEKDQNTYFMEGTEPRNEKVGRSRRNKCIGRRPFAPLKKKRELKAGKKAHLQKPSRLASAEPEKESQEAKGKKAPKTSPDHQSRPGHL